ncbi:hypothetical protein BH18ACT15_BH18ACT15_04560 [soil metagenome]
MTGPSRAENEPPTPEESRADSERDASEHQVIERVRHALRSIEYGSIHIKIHQGEVVTIETASRVRLTGD